MIHILSLIRPICIHSVDSTPMEQKFQDTKVLGSEYC